MYDEITKTKSSRTTADDGITADLLKQIPHLLSGVLCHLFSKIVESSRFPKALKCARVLPLRKKNKCRMNKNSFRPVSILNPIEKVLEEILRKQIVSHFEENNLIPESHHGGREKHGTITAKIALDKKIEDKREDHGASLLLNTDLSQAYDLVSHKLLVKKLKHHGVGSKSCKLIEHFLKDRSYFVDVQGEKSMIQPLGDISVVQGSKNSSFLYTAYNIEVVYLPKLMCKECDFEDVTGEKLKLHKDIEHDVIQYIDNSNNSIGGKNATELISYTEDYHKLLVAYYRANKLHINEEKTTFMVVSHNENPGTRFELKVTEKETIKDDLAVKVLGWWVAPNGQMNYHLNKIRGQVCHNIAKIKPYLSYMSIKERKVLIYSKALSVASYGLELYIGQNQCVKNSLSALFMRGNRAIYGRPLPADTNTEWICSQIGVKTPKQLIIEAALKTIHRVVNCQKPPQLYNFLEFPRFFRKASNIQVVNAPRTIRCRRSTIYKSVRQFNQLHPSLKYCHPKLFKSIIEKRNILEVPDD